MSSPSAGLLGQRARSQRPRGRATTSGRRSGPIQALDVVEPELLARLLDRSTRGRSAAADRVVPLWHAQARRSRSSWLARRVADEIATGSARGRRGPGRVPGLSSRPNWRCRRWTTSDRPVPRICPLADGPAAAPGWLPEVHAGRFDFDGQPRRLVFALQAVGSSAGLKPLLALFQRGEGAEGSGRERPELIAALGGPAELARRCSTWCSRSKGPDPAAAGRPAGHADCRAARRRKVVPSGEPDQARVAC